MGGIRLQAKRKSKIDVAQGSPSNPAALSEPRTPDPDAALIFGKRTLLAGERTEQSGDRAIGRLTARGVLP
jgi:hypothetical protein